MSENHNKFCQELGNNNPSKEESKFFAAAVERDESKAQLEAARKNLKEAEEFDQMARKFIQTPADPSLNPSEVAYGKLKTAELADSKLTHAQRELKEAEKRIEGSKAFARE